MGLVGLLSAAGLACATPQVKSIVQVAQPAPGAAPAAPASATGWQTEAAQKAGIKLLQTFDASGPAAWDAQKHPLVFFTSNGPGYGGIPSKVKLPGLTVIDAKTKEVVASQWYDLKYGVEGADATASEPHSLGVSSDGQWIYLPAADPSAPADDRGRLLVIDAKTLKLRQVIGTQRLPHHSKILTPPDGRKLMLVYDFGGSGIYILDTKNDNKVVAVISDQDLGGRRYLAFPDTKHENIWITVRPSSGVEADGWVAVVSTKDWKEKKNYTVGRSPIWVTFTADGKYAYVDNGHDDSYHKIDILKGAVVGHARNGGSGPYGMALNWDETELWFISKGEGSHNRGKTVSYVDPIAMGRPKDEFYTGCIRGDHIYLYPDPQVNEMWLSCNSSFEVVVWDPVKKEVKARIPMPDGGSTHSGAFVRYTVDGSGQWKGEILYDHGGAQGATLAKRAELAAQAAKKSQ
ncbi:MAG: YncE family protein [Chloroflexi bacterium]|nr:YncE family protein [Chloroflexota bacterium]